MELLDIYTRRIIFDYVHEMYKNEHKEKYQKVMKELIEPPKPDLSFTYHTYNFVRNRYKGNDGEYSVWMPVISPSELRKYRVVRQMMGYILMLKLEDVIYYHVNYMAQVLFALRRPFILYIPKDFTIEKCRPLRKWHVYKHHRKYKRVMKELLTLNAL